MKDQVLIIPRDGGECYDGPVPSKWPTQGLAVAERLRVGGVMVTSLLDLSRPDSGGYALPSGDGLWRGAAHDHQRWCLPPHEKGAAYAIGLFRDATGVTGRIPLEHEYGLTGSLVMALDREQRVGYVAGSQRGSWAITVIRADSECGRWQESFSAQTTGPVTALMASDGLVAWATENGTAVYFRIHGQTRKCFAASRGSHVTQIIRGGNWLRLNDARGVKLGLVRWNNH